MKIRMGFVSNSSSSSFVISLSSITEEQKWKIYNHIEVAKKLLIDQVCTIENEQYWGESARVNDNYVTSVAEHDAWAIEEKDGLLTGDTSMTNFDMEWFMEAIGINKARFSRDG
jgi:hypothetical protein